MTYDMSWLDDFDPTAAAESAGGGSFETVPAGEYDFEILALEMKPIDNDRATGQRLSVRLAVRGDDHDGSSVFDSFCVVYIPKGGGDKEKAAKTEQIGRGRFGTMCVAAGISKSVKDLDALVGKFVRARVGIREYKGEKQNEIKGNFAEPRVLANAKRPAATGDSPWKK